MKKNKNKIFLVELGVVAIGMCLLLMSMLSKSHSEAYIRDRVVKLSSSRGSCSGEQVRAASGQDYILTAGHCNVLIEDGSIMVTMENGKKLQRRVIAEDSASDLLLLEGLPNLQGLDIAKNNYRFQKVRTFTHGSGMDTYETNGAIIQDKDITVEISLAITQEEKDACTAKSKYSLSPFFNDMSMCVMKVRETMTTAMVLPGSSGGPVVDSSGRLIGVVSVGTVNISGLVRLQDIKSFLSGY